MGEVYRARDTKLQRDVAIKVLPEAFASDPDRVSRFEREAQVLASLNHPNIAQVFGTVDQPAGLVMELVEGDDLAARIAHGALPPDDALAVARQAAEALEAAHERGIVHRDLKPANIKVTPAGTVKILDFGLAKALLDGRSGLEQSNAANSPTFTSPLDRHGLGGTGMGVILGTAAYMSPEQARGKPVDRRADIWAFGVVLFEMLTGRHLYEGETASDTIAQILTQEPQIDRLPATTPPAVRRILRRCLQKDPRLRFQSAGDIRIELEEVLADPAGTSATTVGVPPPRRSPLWPWIVAGAAALVAAASVWGWSSRAAPPLSPMRLEVRVGSGERLIVDDNVDGALAVLSPDGRTLVYAANPRGMRQLFVRTLNELESKPLPNTSGALSHFFSPDGRWIAFFAAGKLKKVGLTGGTPIDIAVVADPRGGTWGPDDTIVYTPDTQEGLLRVAASSVGTPEPLTQLAEGERSHRWPQFLPGGKAVLFVRQDQGAAYDDGFIEAVRVDTKERQILVRGGTFPTFAPGGHLLYLRGNTIFSVPFDPDTLELRGEPRPVLSPVLASGGVGAGAGNGAGQFMVSASGTAVYLGGESTSPASRLVLVDRDGKRLYTSPDVRDFRDPSFSPDGTRVALAVGESRGQHLYVLDIARSTMTRVTFDGNVNGLPTWSPDGKRLAYLSDRANTGLNVFITRADGGGQPAAVTAKGSSMDLPTSFSPDGALLAVMRLGPAGNLDTQILSLRTGEFSQFGESSTPEIAARFSPDGRWIAYGEGVGFDSDIYVRPYPGPGGRWQISSGGGGLPSWTKAGRELAWVSGAEATRVMVADVTAKADSLQAGPQRQLFEMNLARPSNATWFDASPDGTRFVVLAPDETAPGGPLDHVTFIFDFPRQLGRDE